MLGCAVLVFALNSGTNGASGQSGKVFGPPIPTRAGATTKATQPSATTSPSGTATTKSASAKSSGKRKVTTTTKRRTATTTKRRTATTVKRRTVTTAASDEQLIFDESGAAGDAVATDASTDSGFTVEVVEGLPTTIGSVTKSSLPRPSVRTVPTGPVAPTTAIALSGPTTSSVSPSTTSTVVGTSATATAVPTTTVVASVRTLLPGFAESGFRFVRNNVPVTPQVRCALVANNDANRAQGLKGRTTLSGYDAMLFSFAVDTTAAFTMQDVPIPLSLAWFDVDGKFLGSVDLPVVAAGQTSPTYSPPGPYRTAMEVPLGALTAVGVASDALLQFGLAC